MKTNTIILAGVALLGLAAYGQRGKLPKEVKEAMKSASRTTTVESVQTKVEMSDVIVIGRITRILSGAIVNHKIEVIKCFRNTLKPGDTTVVALGLHESTDYALEKSKEKTPVVMFLKRELLPSGKIVRWRALSGPTDREKFLEVTPELVDSIEKALSSPGKKSTSATR